MIEISHLNKIYKSKKRKKCHALKDIHLTLPDNGLVFVLGKSGSGKSTLLNLIGGLDNITSGRITVDGNDLSKFGERKFCNYRNTHIGFIFQDYHLIDELTVYDNIALSLNLRRIKDKEAVSKALERVDLAGYEDRYPSELSGGEQQRVAIARAIVKKPRIILADEPTGNLDTNTATAIVTLLKELSKDCLILIVSHNINDANNYADRIIELKKGQVISDLSRNPDFADEVTLCGEELIYPKGLALSDKDIAFMNENLHKRIIKRTDKFIPTSTLEKTGKKVKIENKGLSLWKELPLSGKFLKSKTIAISFSSIMVAIIMVIMSMAQTIINFDAGRILQDEMNKAGQQSILLNKVVSEETQKLLDQIYRVPAGENDIQSFYDAGYKGKIYPVYNMSVPITSSKNAAGFSAPYFGNGIYMTETFGTMIVDEAFLARKFGEVKYHAKLDNFNPAGVIITDYIADCLIAAKGYTAQDYPFLLGEVGNLTIKRGFINAIIDTGYRERYGEFLDKVSADEFESIAEIYEDPAFLNLSNEIYDNLGYSYSTNPDFPSAYNNEFSDRFPWTQRLMINDVLQYNQGHYIIWGQKAKPNMLVDGWAYTITAPAIPANAKYIRVALGVTGNHAINDKNNAFLLNLIDHNTTTIKFSNGYIPSKAQLNFEKGVYLDPQSGSTKSVATSYKSFVSDYLEIPKGCTITEFATYTGKDKAFCAFYDENKNFISSYTPGGGRVDLPSKTIYMNYGQYNELFGTDYTAETVGTFKPHKITLTQYRHADATMENPLFAVEVTIGALRPDNSSIFASKDVIDLFVANDTYVNALYLDGTDGIESVLKMSDELHYEHQSIAIEGIHTMTKAVDVFVPIFELVAIFLCLGVIFILVNFASKMIRDKMHEIGILKALGTKNGAILIVFGLQVFLVAILTCALSTVGYYFFIDIANDVLFQSMQQLVPSQVVLDLDFFVFMPKVAIMDGILVFALSILSLIAPMLKIKAIKPVKIIKAKE